MMSGHKKTREKMSSIIASTRIRTVDLLVTSEALLPLSHRGCVLHDKKALYNRQTCVVWLPDFQADPESCGLATSASPLAHVASSVLTMCNYPQGVIEDLMMLPPPSEGL